MIRNGRQGMRIDNRVEIERRRQGECLRRVYFQGVIVGGGEESLGVERVEGEMRDAEFVGGGRFACFRGGFVEAAIEWVLSALEIP